MDFGFYTINLDWLPDFLYMSPLEIIWWIISSGGWVFFVIFFLWAGKLLWLDWRQNVFASKLEFVFLAIDVPKENRQSPMAIEHIFNQLWGIFAEPTPREKWIDGAFVLSYSLEIVSIEGYIQYIVQAPKKFKDIVEAAFYAQYPDAEITEIRDYTQDFDMDFREKGYNLWGSEIVLVNDQHYPIRTYPQFEHSLTQLYADPLAAILELLASLGPGEQLWTQIVIKPINDKWKEGAEKLMNKLLGIKEGWKKSVLDRIVESPLTAMERMGDFAFNRPATVQEAGAEAVGSQFMNLPPHIQEAVKAIANKCSKTGFNTKMRMIYIAKNEVFAKAKAVPSFFGTLKQYSALNLNAFRPGRGTSTSSATWFKSRDRQIIKHRQDTILRNYKSRSNWAGKGTGFILNTEELASVYHFPGVDLRAPTVQSVQSKKGEAPVYLPVEQVSPFANLKRQIGQDEDSAGARPAVKAPIRAEPEYENEEFSIQQIAEEAEGPTIRIGGPVTPKASAPGNLPIG